ncbi:MAG: xanthine dehydrogenase small subunit [Phycisphaeraceae bacterium]
MNIHYSDTDFMLQSAVKDRDYLLVFINGQRHELRGSDAFLSLSDYLRLRLGLIGTKIVCSEGDCGACSVLIGREDSDHDRLVYRAFDSCILFMYQLDRTHIVTVEGLKRNGLLSPVQDAMVKCHGSQCGFCTPGFITTMTGLIERKPVDRHAALTPEEIRYGLSGNLCRCTGYLQIIDAGRAVDPTKTARLSDLYPDEPILEACRRHALDNIRIGDDQRMVSIPAKLEEAVAFRSQHPHCTVIAGATDIGVQRNKGNIDPKVLLCIGNIAELKGIERKDTTLAIGACETWSSIEDRMKDLLPQFHSILTLFGSPQIRHAGTIGGNIANASPIADSLPFLFVAEAQLELVSRSGSRVVPINEFYSGYKQFDLRPDELIARVHIPLPEDGVQLKLYKVSRRRDLDISTFTAALWLKFDGDQETIREARIAYGGVAPVVLRLPRTENYLSGKQFDEQTMLQAGRIARTEISPITDVRGSEAYRRQLAENIPVKFYYDICQPAGV